MIKYVIKIMKANDKIFAVAVYPAAGNDIQNAKYPAARKDTENARYRTAGSD